MNTIKLLTYPLFELAFFVSAIYFYGPVSYLFYILVFLAALFLNFSLHISFHFHVHFKAKSKTIDRLIDLISSLLMGLPFHYYQMSHWNHHRYDNKIGDFTSTWRTVQGETKAKNFFFSSIFWPFGGGKKISSQKEQAFKEGYLDIKKEQAMLVEGVIILLFIATLFYLKPSVGFAYLGMVYVGWVMIAMHNYGQHLPEHYGELKGNSFYWRVYNVLFFNNGLHNEHHEHPELRYWELKENKTGTIHRPHLLEGFFFRTKKFNAKR